jgi:hypothetical protein
MEWDSDHTCVWMPVVKNSLMEIDYVNRQLTWSITQQFYIQELTPMFGPDVTIMLANFVVPDISIKFRFVHFDPTKPENRKIDNINVVIKSSNEKTTDFCIYDDVVLSGDQISDVHYYIDHIAERDDMYIETYITGLDDLDSECKDNIYFTLDTLLPNN